MKINFKHVYYPWIVVALLWVVALLNYMDRQILATLRPTMALDIKELEHASAFGNLMAVFLWIYGFMSPISGYLADRLNRKNLIVGSLFIWSAVTVAMGFAHSYNELYILRALMGVSEAIYIPAALSLIADFHSDKTRSLAIGIHLTGLYIGQALGGFGALVASNYSWHILFLLLGGVGVIYAFVLLIALTEAPARSLKLDASATQIPIRQRLKVLFSNVYFWVMVFYFAIPSLPGWATKNWLPTLLADNLHIPMERAGPIATVTLAISSLLGVVFGGIISDKWAQKSSRGRIFTSAIGLLLMVPALGLLGYGNALSAALTGAILFGIGFGFFDTNNMPILCQIVPNNYRASGYGILNMFGVFAGALITKILGKSAEAGHLGHDFSMLALLILIVSAVFVLVVKPKTR